ncbi:DMT family transporter [Sinisalibacter aestuarii]|uniref:Membrane protein n=1 Tax=Sinisalibacter aestuarii TaxID=2949426 RepID=A0ABQ5LU18_9RHOB|nr:DMT family transporter [Sinisalibacter aestuarii]GKY87607.1 membrane protein [Sinisalibacter aestuarii]
MSAANLGLFIATVLIWGSTWLAITFQVGPVPVPVPVSVFYRFALAGAVFVAGLALMGRLHLPPRRHQPWIVAQALMLFSLNFLCFYAATAYVPSGLVSVIFSLATIFNALNARLFFGDRITARVLVAGALGGAGIALLFGPDILGSAGPGAAKGIGLATLGTLFFSLGNMVSRRNSAAGLSPVTANAWGMVYGAAILLAILAVTGTAPVMPPGGRYLAALVYLSVIGSIVGFTTYLLLVARIGSSGAAYATVLFPIVALGLSTLFEGYRWHWSGVLGLALALAGNAVMFAHARPAITARAAP